MKTPPPSGEAVSRNPFQAQGFLHWWLASLLAGTGIGIQAVTVPLFIRDRVGLDERALAIAAALIAQTLPGALLALFGGALADRIERRRILARTYSVAAAVSALYVVLAYLDSPFIWPVFLLAVVVGAAGAFTNPARQSMLPQLVGPAQLQNGVIFGTIGFMATLQFFGPMVAGLLTDGLGIAAAFGLEFLLLTLAAVVFSRLKTEALPSSRHTIFADLMAGLRYLGTRRDLLSLVALATLPGIFFIGPFAVTVPIVVPDILHASDKWIGILWGCFGGGVFVCSLGLIAFPIPRRGLAICFSTISGGLVLSAYALSESLGLSCLLLFLWGFGAGIFINYVVALLQQNTTPAMMGRVMSMYSLAFFAASPIGYLQAGLVTDFYGPQMSLLSSGILASIIGIWCLLFARSIRKLR